MRSAFSLERRKPLNGPATATGRIDAPQPAPTRPSFSTAPRQTRHGGPATLGKPLNREFLFYPGLTSLEAGGQWPLCSAGASPTEGPTKTAAESSAHAANSTPVWKVKRCLQVCQEKSTNLKRILACAWYLVVLCGQKRLNTETSETIRVLCVEA